MGYLLALLTTLLIALPSYVFIHIYLDPLSEGLTVSNYFQRLFGGEFEKILEACHTAITEPINVFFEPPNALRILFAFLPWVIIGFAVNFFFRKKGAAKGGLYTGLSLIFTADMVYYFYIESTAFDISMLTQANPIYGYLVIYAVTLFAGIIGQLSSPFKKEKEEKTPAPSSPEPYYMPVESPTRDQYMSSYETPAISEAAFSEPSTSYPLPPPPESSSPPSSPSSFEDPFIPSSSPSSSPSSNDSITCEFCGSYIDSDSEFCSVCGNKVRDNSNFY
jgi:hypothetical protein